MRTLLLLIVCNLVGFIFARIVIMINLAIHVYTDFGITSLTWSIHLIVAILVSAWAIDLSKNK